jgi:two-component system nitrogen regulation response regulator GlnG
MEDRAEVREFQSGTAAGDSRAEHRHALAASLLPLREAVERAVEEAERRAIVRALAEARGNKSQAARRLRTNYTTLHAKMKRYGITAGQYRGSRAAPVSEA